MADDFENNGATLISPAEGAAAVTPHDTTALGNVTRAIYVGGAGDVEVITKGGDTVVFSSVPAGTILPVRATHVKSSNTTASNILAMW